MKLAKSMKFGGQLISAESCDYSSYKELGLICPECGNLVFLAKAQSKISKLGKEFQVPAHFKHFKEQALIADRCELRVKQYSKQDIEKALNQARNQRFKFFQSWFWSLLEELKFNVELKPLGIILKFHDEIYKESADYARQMDRIYDAVKEVLKQEKEFLLDSWFKSYQEKDFDSEYADKATMFVTDVLLSELSTNLNLKLHRQICSEAFNFALSSRNRHQFTRLLYNSVVNVAVINNDDIIEGLQINPKSLKIHSHVITSIICLVPWAKAFDEKTNQATL